MEKAPTPPGVGASIKGGGQENELERTLPLLYYQIVLCTSRKRFEENDENFNKVDFGLIDVEERFGICGKTINKIIKEHYGKTFSDYIEEKRLRLAKTLLEQTDKGMSEVALQCGFANYITFYKFFRKHTGTSPNNFRQARIAERNIISNCN